MFPSPEEQEHSRNQGLRATGGRAGDVRNEPEPDDSPGDAAHDVPGSEEVPPGDVGDGANGTAAQEP